MGRSVYAVIAVFLLAGLFSPHPVSAVSPRKGSTEVVARVGDMTLTAGGLHQYVKGKPQLVSMIGMPGGSRKVIETWVLERAAAMRQLKKQGLDPRTAIKSLSDDEITRLSVKTFQEELPSAVTVTDQDALRAYETNPKKYTVPAMAHVKQMSHAPGTGADALARDVAEKALKKYKEKLDGGAEFEAVYAEAKKAVPGLVMKDFGYILLDGSYTGEEIVAPLKSRQSVVHQTGEAVFLTYVAQRKESVLEPFETLKDFIRKDLQGELTNKRTLEYFDGLKKEFDAEILP